MKRPTRIEITFLGLQRLGVVRRTAAGGSFEFRRGFAIAADTAGNA
jgi:hypothetical protein